MTADVKPNAELVERVQHAKTPVGTVAAPYGHPFHPIFVTIPIGAWVCSLVFDIATKVDDNGSHALTEATYWLIGDVLTRVQTGQLLLSAVALGLLMVSGWIGGMLAYRYGVRVADENTQLEGYA